MRKIIKKQTDLSLDKLSEALKNPPQNVYVSVYTKIEAEDKPVKKSRQERMTLVKLAKIVADGFERVNTRINNLERDINARLDYIVKANDLKDLSKSK